MKLKSFFRFLLFAAILSGLAWGIKSVTLVHAAGMTVNSLTDTQAEDGECTLREAILNANNDNQSGSADCVPGSGADVITFGLDGTITLGAALPVITDAAGLTVDGAGHSVTISGNSAVQIFNVDTGKLLTVKDLSLVSGVASYGGAIENRGTVNVDKCDFASNSAGQGGAIFNWNDPSIFLTVANSTFQGNSASGFGGAIRNYYGNLDVSNSAFVGNTGGGGGGIYTVGVTGTLNIFGSTFQHNSANGSVGAGLYTWGPMTVTNSTFYDNSNTYAGDGIFNDGGALTVINSTLNQNFSSTTLYNNDNFGTTTLKNTILVPQSGSVNCGGTIINGGNNIDSDGTCGFGSANGSISGIDPSLGALTGSPAYFPLNPGSPAIDGVTWSTPNDCPALDQRGYGRPVDGDADGSDLCDIGSYEYLATLPTATPTFTSTPENTATGTPYPTGTMTLPPTETPTITETPEPTETGTPTITETPTITLTPTRTGTITPTLTLTPLSGDWPDLVITSMRIELETGGACNFTSTNLGVRVWFANTGTAPAGPFVVEVNGAQKTFAAGLLAGQGGNLWFLGYNNGAPNNAWVDATDQVAESNESNNQVSQMVPVPTLPRPCTPTPTITPTPTVTRTITPTSIKQTFTSIAAQDGWILEKSEFSNAGGSLNALTTTFQLGDDTARRQFRAVLSFDTSALPNNAVIKSAQVKIMQSGKPVGKNPFNILGSLWVDIRQGFFGNAAVLQLSDFNTTASAVKVGAFNKTPASGWYTDTLTAAGLLKINKAGLTQLRLYFASDDNNDHIADYMKFFSGNSATNKPKLVITYIVP